MSSGTTIKPGPPSKSGQGVLPSVAPTSQTILLDKLNARRSTPDSEALASSDDEADPHRHDPQPATAQPHRPVRRASWLNDTSSQAVSHPRKGSFASSSMSPTTSHPTTPSADQGVGSTWASHTTASGVLNRGHPNPSSFPWGPPVWNSERKEPPSRLAEVLPSPSSGFPPGISNHPLYGESGLTQQTSPGPRDQGSNAQIPFAIPLHPTPKTYRSQSYSVGQLEPDSATAAMGPTAAVGSRCRPTPHSGLQHRPSRPSMLSEMASDGSMLGKVNEDEDDDDSTGSLPGSQPETVEERLERLTRENTILKQREQQHMYQNSRIMRPRASSSAAYALGNGYLQQEPVPEESDYAIDELDESHDPADLAARRGLPRRMSEYGAGPFRSPYPVENRKLDSVKKAIWQSSLGFGGLGDISQSRRHSFADVPQRQGSIASIADSVGPHDQGSQDAQHSQEFPSPYSENPNFPTAHQVSSYFPGAGLAGSQQQQAMAQSAYGGGGQFPSPYAPIHAPYANRPTSPHRNMYGMTQPRHNQLLHIVLFKCARADVFYIQEGTGLTVKPGDLVIVEADRGTDLGTVAKDNVDWQTAKDLKEHYAEEQYKWLMMYSHNGGAAQGGTGADLMVASNGMQGSAVGGMGPPNPHHMQEPNSGELKPKLIKRLAQSHEIHALRDKEGNEAKAKRVCMQKVKEHGLNMEILDAEFQMDWKKLTFYYFADSYINFNSLVTDLFKIYKTRIWMSAINPASFASPTLGLQAPSGIGPGAVGVGRGSGTATDRRPNPAAPEQQQQQQPPTFTNVPNHNNRVVRPSNSHSSFNESAGMPASNYTAAANSANYSYNPYGGAFQNNNRPGGLPYAPGMVQGLDQFQSGFPQSSDYHLGRGRFPTPQSGGAQHDHQSVSPLSQQAEWVGTFQGLSL